MKKQWIVTLPETEPLAHILEGVEPESKYRSFKIYRVDYFKQGEVNKGVPVEVGAVICLKNGMVTAVIRADDFEGALLGMHAHIDSFFAYQNQQKYLESIKTISTATRLLWHSIQKVKDPVMKSYLLEVLGFIVKDLPREAHALFQSKQRMLSGQDKHAFNKAIGAFIVRWMDGYMSEKEIGVALRDAVNAIEELS